MFPGADRKTKDSIMPPFILVFLLLVIFVCAFGYMTYRYEAEKRAWEKQRNQCNDRV
jgi:cell division protein FtsL